MPIELQKYRIKDLNTLTQESELVNKILEVENADGTDKNYKVGFPTLVQAVVNNSPGANNSKTLYKSVRCYSPETWEYNQGNPTLTELNQDFLALGCLCYVEFPTPSREYRLVYSATGPLNVWLSGDFQGQRIGAKWVEKDSLEDKQSNISDFNPFQAKYNQGDIVKYTQAGILRLYSAKKDLVKSEFGDNKIPEPTGLATDNNWVEINTEPAPNSSRLGQIAVRWRYASQKENAQDSSLEDLTEATPDILHLGRTANVELGAEAGTYKLVYSANEDETEATVYQDGRFISRVPGKWELVTLGGGNAEPAINSLASFGPYTVTQEGAQVIPLPQGAIDVLDMYIRNVGFQMFLPLADFPASAFTVTNNQLHISAEVGLEVGDLIVGKALVGYLSGSTSYDDSELRDLIATKQSQGEIIGVIGTDGSQEPLIKLKAANGNELTFTKDANSVQTSGAFYFNSGGNLVFQVGGQDALEATSSAIYPKRPLVEAKFSNGLQLQPGLSGSIPSNGTLETDGDDLYITLSGNRLKLPKTSSGGATEKAGYLAYYWDIINRTFYDAEGNDIPGVTLDFALDQVVLDQGQGYGYDIYKCIEAYTEADAANFKSPRRAPEYWERIVADFGAQPFYGSSGYPQTIVVGNFYTYQGALLRANPNGGNTTTIRDKFDPYQWDVISGVVYLGVLPVGNFPLQVGMVYYCREDKKLYECASIGNWNYNPNNLGSKIGDLVAQNVLTPYLGGIAFQDWVLDHNGGTGSTSGGDTISGVELVNKQLIIHTSNGDKSADLSSIALGTATVGYPELKSDVSTDLATFKTNDSAPFVGWGYRKTAPKFHTSLKAAFEDPDLQHGIVICRQSHPEVTEDITNTVIQSFIGNGCTFYANGHSVKMPMNVYNVRFAGTGNANRLLAAVINGSTSTIVGTTFYNCHFLNNTLVPRNQTIKLVECMAKVDLGYNPLLTEGTGTLIIGNGCDIQQSLDPATTIQDLRSTGGGNSSSILDFRFEAGYALTFTTTVTPAEAGTYTTDSTSNVASVEYKVNNAVVTLPFAVAAGNSLTVTVTKADNALGAVVVIRT